MRNVLRQIHKVQKHMDTVALEFDDDNPEVITIHMRVDEGIHEGANYQFRVSYQNGFDSKPCVICDSEIWHPNIRADEEVCCNLFRDDWDPDTTLSGIIAILYGLLENPNFKNPLNKNISKADYVFDVQQRLRNQNNDSGSDSD